MIRRSFLALCLACLTPLSASAAEDVDLALVIAAMRAT
jgi:hypothetical protein